MDSIPKFRRRTRWRRPGVLAKARGIGMDTKMQDLIRGEHTEGRTFGLLGEARVNVLKLNLALDAR